MGLFDWFRSKPVGEWSVGQRILAQWRPEVFFYPGIIKAIDGDKYQVQFDDGDRAQVSAEEIAALDIKVGSRVYGRFQGGLAYFPGKIDQRDGERIHIHYDDGDEEWTAVSMIRVERK